MCMQLCGYVLRVRLLHTLNTSQLENLKRAYSKVMEKRDEGKLTSISQVVQQEFLLGAELAGYTCTDIHTHTHTLTMCAYRVPGLYAYVCPLCFIRCEYLCTYAYKQMHAHCVSRSLLAGNTPRISSSPFTALKRTTNAFAFCLRTILNYFHRSLWHKYAIVLCIAILCCFLVDRSQEATGFGFEVH